ncbi:MAG: peroxide stress protein YaaA [Flammeovirgaceae bacterium]|nr:peroxide stress protein YaaA [Flammeovirgaceae bacterium]MDW8287972.1 peroxide stress protein YaaA [Flammeovirgaceae bacterium]
MIAVLSPAKTLDFSSPLPLNISMQHPIFAEKSVPIVNELQKLGIEELQNLMDISPELAELNLQRYRVWKNPPDAKNTHPAIYAFKGDVYVGLQAETFDMAQMNFAEKHLRILSGLYGILRPSDLIQPYRLEMGTKLSVANAKNLYDYWKNEVTEFLREELSQHHTPILLNLASQEYFKVIDTKKLNFPIIHIDFKEEKNGKYSTVGFFAKKARGMMARFIVENQLDNPEDLKSFSSAHYRFNPALSDTIHWIFTRP